MQQGGQGIQTAQTEEKSADVFRRKDVLSESDMMFGSVEIGASERDLEAAVPMARCRDASSPAPHISTAVDSAPIAQEWFQNGNALPDVENCMHGISPDASPDAGGKRKLIVPIVTSMTKHLFDHYRLLMYSFLNRNLRSGYLKSIVGFDFSTRVINREVCTFRDVSYWRMDRLSFWADVATTLRLETDEGVREWRGYLCLWFCAETLGSLTGAIEELVSEKEGVDREGMVMLSPYLIPYFTSRRMDAEAEGIWEECIPGALADSTKRSATALAEAMGLSIRYCPLHKHKSVDSILFLIDDTILVSENEMRPAREERVAANTIVINSNVIKRDYSDFSIYHECVHYYEHYLFFCLQAMHNNDILRMKTEEIIISDDEEGIKRVTNPVYWMEKQANRGAYGLMMPQTFMREQIAAECKMLRSYRHFGDKYEQIGMALGRKLHLPHFRIRARMIQLGHVYAKGALNYVDCNRIQPFCFEADSLRLEEHTFVIDRVTAGRLYEVNADFRKALNSGKFIFADGHIARNEPRFVEITPKGYMLTPWANEHVDQCCLRFVRIYEQRDAGKYIFGRMNYDADYVKQTLFYLEDAINERELDEIDAELEYKRNFPPTFIEAFDMLMRKNGSSRERIAERLSVSHKTLARWLNDPEKSITADFVVMISLIWKIPDWISALLLDRAYIRLSETNRRHLALRYILKVLWSEGLEKANGYLASRELDHLTIG